MLNLTPLQLQGGHYALPLTVLAPLGLAATRRRFSSPAEALAWFLTSPWTQASTTRGP